MSVALVVEDDSELLAGLEEALQDEGWTVLTASSADAALRVMCSTIVDVVLCDVLLPGPDGVKFRNTVGGDPMLAHIPFVFMTGGATNAGHLDGTPLLAKPFRAPEASRVLAAAAARQRRTRLRQTA